MRIALLAGCFLGVAAWPIRGEFSRADGGLAALVVSVDESSPQRETWARGLRNVVNDLSGKAGEAPKFVVTKSGQGILWGDFFRTGGCFALVEIPGSAVDADDAGVVFAEWVQGAWALRQAWKISTVWRREGWKESHEDYLPTTPATQAFELEDFNGDGVPEVIFAGEVAQYFQERYLLAIDPKPKELRLVASAMARPQKVEECVQLYFDSGRRSIWTERQFYRWSGIRLAPVASWHSETGYNERDPSFSEGERTGADGKPVTVRVLYGHGQEIEGDRYALSRNGQPFGTMRVAWKDPEHLPPDADEMEGAWLFEKITGLPRRLYPDRQKGKRTARLEDFATVTVEGNPEAAKLFEMRR